MGILSKLNDDGTPYKSLGFGNDRPGGGSSKQPYIKKPINLGLQNPAYSNEFIVRGGLEAPVSALEDVVRLTKYFFDLRNPSGLLFVAKQNILSRVAVKSETSYGFAYGGFTQDINTQTGDKSINESNGIFNDGIYTPLSTLVQAGIGWAGGHVNKQGLDPSGIFPSFAINKYIDVAYDRNRAERNTEDPKVPYALYRKAQKATAKLAREREKLVKQGQETIDELNTPANSFSLSSSNPDSAAKLKSLQKAENVINKFVQKWDSYRDQIELNKLTRQAKDTQKAIDKSTDLNNQVAAAESAPPVFNNRLLKLWNATGLNLANPIADYGSVLFSYSGGPDSILGIGSTKIHFATKNDGITPDRTNQAPGGQVVPVVYYNTVNIFGDANSSVSLKYAQDVNPTISSYDLFGDDNFLENYNETPGIRTFSVSDPSNTRVSWATWTDFNGVASSYGDDIPLEDFRSFLDIQANPTILSASPSYIDKNIETNFNLGNPGQRGNISSYTNGKRSLFGGSRLGPADRITGYPIYKTNSKDGSKYPGAVGGTEWDDALKDIIPFYIAILNNDTQVGGTYKKYMHFRAFIDAVSDSYDADWDAIEYMGRAEKFYKYGGFSRKMSLSFKVVAQSREELNLMYDKLNFLASSLAPEYLDSEVSGYMAGNIAYITLGGYLVDQPGIITNIDYDISEDSPWEIGIDDNGDPLDPKDIRQLPHMIDVKLNFIPIHKFRPEKQTFVNDTLGTDSTRLLATGKQRYLDQKRPKVLNYDKEAYNAFLKEKAEAERLEAASTLQAGLDRIAIQNAQLQNIILDSPEIQNPDVALGDQSGLITGVDTSNSIFSNTLFQ
jgi:hypothetical protein